MSGAVSYAGTIEVVSVDSAGQFGNNESIHPAINADGRYVAFQSRAGNLVPGNTNDKANIFVHDRKTGKTEIVSKNSAGTLGDNDSDHPSLSADGRYVAFDSFAGNLAPGDNNGKADVYVHERKTGKTTIISKDSAGVFGNDHSLNPAISADGRFVAFQSAAGNLMPGDTNGILNIFVHDRKTGKTTIISKDSAGKPGNQHSFSPAVSADGRYVAFHSLADNLVLGVANGKLNIFVHDTKTGETTGISKDGAGAFGNGNSNNPVISADGRYVAFDSYAGNLAPGDTDGKANVFVHDRQTGETTIISKNSAGRAGNDNSSDAAISADGRYVAFESAADNLVPGDANGKDSDAFLYDRRTGEMKIISKNSAGAQGSGSSCFNTALSADGRYAAFESNYSNLAPKDTNGVTDVFVRDTR
jgi:Tol biopolymer transport system component